MLKVERRCSRNMNILENLGSISKAKITQLNKKGINSVEDLAEDFPRDYVDMRWLYPKECLLQGEWGSAFGRIIRKKSTDRCHFVVLLLPDNSEIRVTWFCLDPQYREAKEGSDVFVCGKVNIWNNEVGFISPLKFDTDQSKVLKIHPIYKKRSGISEVFMQEKISESIFFLQSCLEPQSKKKLASDFGLVGYIDALKNLHYPQSPELIEAAQERMDFEKLYRFYALLNKKVPVDLDDSISTIKNKEATSNFIENILPYELTPGQKSVITSFYNKVNSKQRVNSLVSGDVGCGKTVVAMIYSLMMVENGHQVAIMAPTVVLARQHYEEFTKMMKTVTVNGKPVVIEFLTGKTKTAHRKKILKDTVNGEISILIGTHAVASDTVEFNNLGLIVVDEEHKFGVIQKTKILDFYPTVHYTSMTATPIPRSIGLSIFGNDVELLPIHYLPSGRKSIITEQFFDHKPMFDKVMEQISLGHQAYIIAPLIEKSDNKKMEGVISIAEAESMFKEYLLKYHPTSNCKVALINGKMSEDDVATGIENFAEKQADVLISTTIVEVGVNVPNATVICILSAGRFGLAGLHQLRGRVGRNSAQGYCYLLEQKRTERLDVICLESNGFKIAEEDLRLRGPGDLVGESQKGLNIVIDIILARREMANVINESFRSQ